MSLQQTAQSTLPTTSMSMSGSGHGSGPGYSHSGPASQSVPLQSQGAISNYVSRANINMQSNPGTAPLGPWPFLWQLPEGRGWWVQARWVGGLAAPAAASGEALKGGGMPPPPCAGRTGKGSHRQKARRAC